MNEMTWNEWMHDWNTWNEWKCEMTWHETDEWNYWMDGKKWSYLKRNKMSWYEMKWAELN